MQPVKAENETNGPKPVVTVSNQTYLPITSDLSTYEGRNLGFFRAPAIFTFFSPVWTPKWPQQAQIWSFDHCIIPQIRISDAVVYYKACIKLIFIFQSGF